MLKTFPELCDRFVLQFLPASLDDSAIQRIRSLGQAVFVRRGEEARLPGDGSKFVFLADGATKLVAHASGDREQIVAFHFAGDLVCVPAMASHAYALNALSDSELLVFPECDFLDLAKKHVVIMAEIHQRLMIALGRCREKTVSLGRKTAPERLADFLLSMSTRLGTWSGSTCILRLPMSRRDIGDSLGLTIETVSRQFSEFKAQGLIETQGRSAVSLLDFAGLEQRAGHYSLAT